MNQYFRCSRVQTRNRNSNPAHLRACLLLPDVIPPQNHLENHYFCWLFHLCPAVFINCLGIENGNGHSLSKTRLVSQARHPASSDNFTGQKSGTVWCCKYLTCRGKKQNWGPTRCLRNYFNIYFMSKSSRSCLLCLPDKSEGVDSHDHMETYQFIVYFWFILTWSSETVKTVQGFMNIYLYILRYELRICEVRPWYCVTW